MPITVHVHCLRCILLDQSLNTDIFAAHVAGTVIPLASAITNLYVEVTQHILNYGCNVAACGSWQRANLQQFLPDI